MCMGLFVDKYPEVVKELIADFLEWEHGFEVDVPRKIEIIEHLGLKGIIKATKELHNKYKNIEVLLDGKSGYADFSTGQWIGQKGKELEFIIDLKDIKPINKITVGYLQSTGNWVFGPKFFEVSFSDNGVVFEHVLQSKSPERLMEKGNYTDNLSLDINQKSRYLKIRINGIGKIPKGYSGEGNQGWFFIDEIIIE